MKKLIACLLILSLFFAFCGCATPDSKKEEGKHTEKTDAEEITVQSEQSNTTEAEAADQADAKVVKPLEETPNNEVKAPEESEAVKTVTDNEALALSQSDTVHAVPSETYSANNIDTLFFDYIALAAELAPDDISGSVSALSDGVAATKTDNLRDFSITTSDQSLYHFLVDIDGSIEMIIAVIPNESYSEYLMTSLIHLHSGIDTGIISDDLADLLPLVINNGENQSATYTNYAVILSPFSSFTMVTAVFSESYQSDNFYANRFTELSTSIATHVASSN